MSERRFPPPWSVVEFESINQTGSFRVEDAAEMAVVSVYYDDGDPVRRRSTHAMTRDEARRIASNIAKLPALLGAKARE